MSNVGLSHHVLVYKGELHLVHPALNTEFVYPGCWHFDNGETSKFDDVLLEHGGTPPLSLKVMGGGWWWWWWLTVF